MSNFPSLWLTLRLGGKLMKKHDLSPASASYVSIEFTADSVIILGRSPSIIAIESIHGNDDGIFVLGSSGLYIHIMPMLTPNTYQIHEYQQLEVKSSFIVQK